MPLILGIDPGLHGAAVLIRTDRTLMAVLDFSNYTDFIQAMPALERMARQADLIALEKPSAMPAAPVPGQRGQGVASAFNFGYTCRLIRGTLFAHLNVREPRPAFWKGAIGLSAD